MKKRDKLLIFLSIIMLLTSSLLNTITYARYKNETSDTDEIRVAKSGTLKLIEKQDGVIQINNAENSKILEYEITLGNDIDKEVYIEFADSEVSTYLFLVIKNINWTYNDDIKKLFIESNGTHLLEFNLNDNWIYLSTLSQDEEYIFYQEVDINDNNTIKYDIMNQISTGLIMNDDIEKINNSQLSFSAYSIQKNKDLTVEQAWNYLNI